jgi:hypothetical protein
MHAHLPLPLDKPGIPDLVTKLSIWMGEQYAFVVFHDPPESMVQAMGEAHFPPFASASQRPPPACLSPRCCTSRSPSWPVHMSFLSSSQV